MSDFKRILAIVDPTSDEHPALHKAAAIAARYEAQLELFVCESRAVREARIAAKLVRPSTESPAGEAFAADPKGMLEALAEPLRARGLQVTTEIECGEPLHVALIDRAKRAGADLMVKDTHHHSLLKRTLLTNTDWELIRRCPMPLLLTKPAKWRSLPVFVAAVDPGHADDKPAALDHRILALACGLAGRMAARLRVVHAYIPVAIIAGATAATPPMVGGVSPEVLAAEEEAKRRQLRALTAPYRIPQEDVYLDVGAPGEFLPRVAEELHADVMVMGAIARSGLKRIFVGNTAERVLERLPCDALIVKPLAFPRDLPC